MNSVARDSEQKNTVVATEAVAAKIHSLAAELDHARREAETLKNKLEIAQRALDQTRAELDQNRLRREQFYQAAPAGYLEFDAPGTIRYANVTAGKLLGLPPEIGPNLLVGKPFSVFLRGEGTLRFSEHLRACLVNQQRRRVQLEIHPRHQSPLPVFLASVPVIQQGKAVLCRTVMLDNTEEVALLRGVTERLAHEQIARREAEQDRDFMQLVLAHSPVLIGALEGSDFRIKWLNPAAVKAIGSGQAGDVGRRLSELIPGFCERLLPLLVEVHQTAKPLLVPDISLPLRRSERSFQLALAPLSPFVAHPFAVVFIALDITETKRSTEALAASENRLRLALHAARMATCDWHIGDKTISWSGSHDLLFGGAPPQTRENFDAFEALVYPADRGLFRPAIAKAAQQGGLFDVEFRLVWPDQSLHWLQLQGLLFLGLSGEPQRAVGVIIEVTQQKQVEAALRNNQNELESRVNERTAELAQAISALRRENIQRQIAQAARDNLVRQLAAAQEEERRRVSRELHDETGQHLTALLLGLKTLEPRLNSPEALRQLKDLQSLTGQLGEEIHRIAVQLRPTALDDLGLHKTLTNFVEEWSSRSKVAVEFHVEGLDKSRLPSEIETILYRIVQASLTNVTRHAAASNVCLVLQRHPKHVSLIIEDDGKGFNVAAAFKATPHSSKERAHLGLRGMKERVSLVGGELEIESFPNDGTTLFVRIPLSGKTERSRSR